MNSRLTAMSFPSPFNHKSRVALSVLAIVAALLSVAKFQPCRANNFASPDNYIKMCYSDLPALYGAREINIDRWPYSSTENSVEYPVVTGLVMWATGQAITDQSGYKQYFDLNLVLLALLFVATALLLWRIRPEYAYLLSLSPAVIASLYINWDLWAVLPALAAVALFKVGRSSLSAIALGVAIATKFFPIVLLLGVGLFFLTSRRYRALANYFLITGFTWLAINLPVALNDFGGWSRFYRMNFGRENDLGSIWLALQYLGLPSGSGIFMTIFVLSIGTLLIANYHIQTKNRIEPFQSFALSGFFAVALFVTVSKVYSPQYVLWLTPLALIAMSRREQRSAFWIWQGGEALYHFAVWQYLATYTGAKFGLPEDLYALAILVRIATLAYFVTVLSKTSGKTATYPQLSASISR